MMQQSQGEIDQSLKSPPPKIAIKIFSPTVEYVSHLCLECESNTEKHFCSISCQATWYAKWNTNTSYPTNAKVTNDKRLIDYKLIV